MKGTRELRLRFALPYEEETDYFSGCSCGNPRSPGVFSVSLLANLRLGKVPPIYRRGKPVAYRLPESRLIYLAYVLRAIRWAIFLKPTAPTSFRRLIAPQIIGFAALGLFGRAGEFARPYLIARKQKLTFTSQLAVWTVERFFDLGSVLVIMVLLLIAPESLVPKAKGASARAGSSARPTLAFFQREPQAPLCRLPYSCWWRCAFCCKGASEAGSPCNPRQTAGLSSRASTPFTTSLRSCNWSLFRSACG